MPRTKIINAGTSALTLPPPYFSPLKAGASVVVADDLATVNGYLGATPGLWRTEVEPDSGGTTPVTGPLGAANLALFVSTEQTGTGAAQNIAHGLGVVPSKVFVAPTDTSPVTVGAYTVTEGAHTSTNVVVTVTSGKKFKVLALA